MVLDASALLAVLFREEGYEELLEELRRTRPHKVAAPTLAEAGIVLCPLPKGMPGRPSPLTGATGGAGTPPGSTSGTA